MPSTLEFQSTSVMVPGLGTMGMSQSYGPTDDVESMKTLAKAVEIGCTFWDTASVYGTGHNEQLLGDFFRQNEGAREKVFLASKCGIEIDTQAKKVIGTNNDPALIRQYIDDSTARLGSAPDLYYIHRIDPKVPIEESVKALDEVRKAGKCKYIGLSECSAETLRKACAVAHIDALQIEYSPWYTDHEENGLIDAAKELGVTIVAYSPIGKGILSGRFRSPDDFPEGDIRRTIPRFSQENMPKNLRIVDEFRLLARKKGCESSQLALAWVIAQGAIPIAGTRSKDRIVENFGASKVELNDEELKELRTLIEEAKPVGDRYNAAGMSSVGK